MVNSQEINLSLFVLCFAFCIGGLMLVGCETGEKSGGAEQANAKAPVSSEQSSEEVGESELKVRLVAPDKPAAEEKAKESPAPTVERKVEVADSDTQSKSKSGVSDIYADRPDPFSERRIRQLEAKFGEFGSIAMPDKAIGSE